jgi:thiosulfate/3-mercaptopyruvate sulfurtransferase
VHGGVRAQTLISAEELAPALRSVSLLDVRWELGGPPGVEGYRAGHVPGAAFSDLETELAGSPGEGGRHPLPDADAFEASMRRAGVSNGRPVVAYDAATSMAAARAWWLLRYFGHQAVSVLDGGLAGWVSAGGVVEVGDATVSPGDFVVRRGGMPVLDAAGAAGLAARGVLLDARAPERFRGESEPIDPIAGHIPGAVNLPTAKNVESSGRFLAPGALRDAFASVGVREGFEVGAYCGSGVTAAHEVLALELAGFRAALYVGSWSEWITDSARPVAVGAD